MPNILEKIKKRWRLEKGEWNADAREKGREGGQGKKEKKYLIFNEHE